MTDKNKTMHMTANAVTWAALMIATALILRGTEGDQREFLIMLQVAGWFVTNQALIKYANYSSDE